MYLLLVACLRITTVHRFILGCLCLCAISITSPSSMAGQLYGGDVVGDANQALNRTDQTLPDLEVPFDLSTPLSPISTEYTGPVFYGGHSLTNSGSGDLRNYDKATQMMASNVDGDKDAIRFVAQTGSHSLETYDGRIQAVLLFPAGGVSVQDISSITSVTKIFAGQDLSGNSEVHLVLGDADGTTWVVSESFVEEGNRVLSVDPAVQRWRTFDPTAYATGSTSAPPAQLGYVGVFVSSAFTGSLDRANKTLRLFELRELSFSMRPTNRIYGGDVVGDSSQAFGRTDQTLPDLVVPFDLSVPLSPASSYTGSAFYGGYAMTNAGTGDLRSYDKATQAVSANAEGSNDAIRLVALAQTGSSAPSTYDGSLSGVIVFPVSGTLEPADIRAIGVTADTYANADYSSGFTCRIAVGDSTGTSWAVSDYTAMEGFGSYAVDPDLTTWKTLDTTDYSVGAPATLPSDIGYAGIHFQASYLGTVDSAYQLLARFQLLGVHSAPDLSTGPYGPSMFDDVSAPNGDLSGMWHSPEVTASEDASGVVTLNMDSSSGGNTIGAGKSWAPDRSPNFPFGSVVEFSVQLDADVSTLSDGERGPLVEIRMDGPLNQRIYLFLNPAGLSTGVYHQDIDPWAGVYNGRLTGRFYVPANTLKIAIGFYNSKGTGTVRWSDIQLRATTSSPSSEWAGYGDFSEEAPPPPEEYHDLVYQPFSASTQQRERLLLFGQTPADIQQKAMQPEWDLLRQQLIADANQTLADPLPGTLEDMDVGPTRRELRRIQECTIVYWITGDTTYRDHAILRLMNHAARPAYLPSRHGFIDFDLTMAETVFGMSLAYDWLYHALTEEQRQEIRIAIVERLLPYYLYESDKAVVKPNVNGKENWATVLSSSVIIAALAFEGEHPIFSEALARADANSIAWREHQSDGGQSEGTGYWNYAFSYAWAAYMERLNRTGNDDGFFSEPGRSDVEVGWFPIVMKPHGPAVGYGDDWPDSRWTIVPLYMERTEGHRKYTPWMQKWLLNNAQGLYDVSLYGNNTPNLFGLGMALVAAIDNTPRAIDASNKPDNFVVYPKTGYAIAASSWPEPDYYVNARAGLQNLHCHADLGSFQYGVDGELLLDDPGAGSYTQSGYFNWNKRFDVYKARAEDHNIFTIDGFGNKLDNPYDPDHQMMEADILNAHHDEYTGVSRWTVVLDECYEGLSDVHIRRHFVFVESTGELAVIDELSLDQPRIVRQHFLTRKALSTLDASRIRIEGDTSAATLHFFSTGSTVHSEMGPHGPSPDEPDGSLKRLRLEMATAQELVFATFIVPGSNVSSPQFSVSGDQVTWAFPISGIVGELTLGGPQVSGTIDRDYWTGVSGIQVADLTGRSFYPDNPDGMDLLTSLEALGWAGSANPGGTQNWADSYGQRIHGYIVPETSGEYIFWVSANNAAELWLSRDASPGKVERIAHLSEWCDPEQWDKYVSQKSAPIELQAGQVYYIEVIHKELAGNDHCVIGWSKPGDPQTTPGEIVPAAVLAPASGGIPW